MAVWSEVRLSGIKQKWRFDAEYWQPKYVENENFLKGISKESSVKRVYDLVVSVKGSAFYPSFTDYYSTEGMPFIRVADLGEFFIKEEQLVRIDKNIIENYRQVSTIDEEDIVVAKGGSIGGIAFIQEGLGKCAVCRDVIALETDEKRINPLYLVAYLKSRFGQLQLERNKSQQVQPHLTFPAVGEVLVVCLSQEKQGLIASRIKEAYNLITQSQSFYAKAESLLLTELSLNDLDISHKLYYDARFTEMERVKRFDAQFFQPYYERIDKQLEKFDAVPIGEIDFVDVTTGQYTEKYVEKSIGKPYIRGVDIERGSINTDDLVYILPESQIRSKKAREGDVVVTRVGTIGLTARIPKECHGGTISDNLIRLRFPENELNSYYVALFLGSFIGKDLMIRYSRGSVQQRLNQETLKEIELPLLPDHTQKKLAELVKQSQESKAESKRLLEEAKRVVEEMVLGA